MISCTEFGHEFLPLWQVNKCGHNTTSTDEMEYDMVYLLLKKFSCFFVFPFSSLMEWYDIQGHLLSFPLLWDSVAVFIRRE